MQTINGFVKNSILVTLTGCLMLIASCKREFDSPPDFTDPSITVTKTIAEIKALHAFGKAEALPDETIQGVVVADDKSGNYYKQISIQDASGGITIRLDGTNLYANYPVGRKIYIKTKGLYIGDYAGLIQIGGSINDSDPSFLNVNPIASTLFDTYIIKGATNNPVTPTVVTVANLTDAYQSMLIQLDNAEFIPADTNKTYANATTQLSANLNVKTCGGETIIVRTSGFANFAGIKAAKGNGKLVAIYTRFNSTKQLIIRDTSDVKFTGPRCTAPPTTFISIADLRNLYAGSDLTLDAKSIKGIVISDASTGKNISNGNLVLQDGNRGIDLYFGSATATVAQLATFKPGDSLVVDLTGAKLTSFNGMLELSMSSAALPSAAIRTAANGAGLSVKPVVMTIKDAMDNIDAIENTLVTINNATASPAGSYSGNKTLTDASGAMLLRTVTGAAFANDALPTTCQNWTGYVSRFNADKQLFIRNPATDLSAGANCGGGSTGGSGIALVSSPLTLDFNGIGAALPAGVTIRNGASATAIGAEQTVNTGLNFHWGTTSGGAKVFASATGLTSSTDSATQSTTTNRAIGYRQTGSNGDPGAAFVFQLDNTTGKSNLGLSFLLQSLDVTSTRTVTWAVDYGIGDAPTAFTPVTVTGTATTGGSSFSNNPVTVSFGNALDNKSQKVWIRIVALSASTGSSNRPSSAVDDVKFTWN